MSRQPNHPDIGPTTPASSQSCHGVHTAHARVTYRMTDQMGVVYYGHYFELFEIGRAELLRAAGLSYRQMERDGYLLPVVHAAADYRAPARYDDLLAIHTRIERLTRVRIHFAYEITRQGEPELLCRGVTCHAVIGADGRPRRFDQAWLERLGRLS